MFAVWHPPAPGQFFSTSTSPRGPRVDGRPEYLGRHTREKKTAAMATTMLALKGFQLLPNGIGGLVMSTDLLHGKVSADFVNKFGFPVWFPTALGLYKLTQLALNWVSNGAFVPIAQCLFAFQLGGASFTHAVVEKPNKGLSALAPCAVFGAIGVAISSLDGRLGGVATVVALHGALAIAGWYSGYAILALGNGAPSGPASPVKWGKHGGGI